MSDFLSDLGALRAGTETKVAKNSTSKAAGSSNLNMDDFLQLIVAQFQNQDPENAASSSDMLNQLVQMSVIQAISNITDATTMMYSSSLVGKEVTIGVVKDGKLQEIVGTVTATGTYNGEPVIFVDGVSYSLSSIMAVGRLPAPEKPEEKPDPDKPPATDPPATETPTP